MYHVKNKDTGTVLRNWGFFDKFLARNNVMALRCIFEQKLLLIIQKYEYLSMATLHSLTVQDL